MKRLTPGLTALTLFAAACGPEDARHVRVELDVAAPSCDRPACVEHLTGSGLVVPARAPEQSDELAAADGQSMLYAEATTRAGALAMVEIAWGGGASPRVRYREVSDGQLSFSGRVSSPTLDLPEPGEPWLRAGAFAFIAVPASSAATSSVARVVTGGRVLPLETDQVRVETVETGDPRYGVSTHVVLVIDGSTRYDEVSGCDSEPDPIDVGSDPSPTDPSPTDPSTEEPPPSTGVTPVIAADSGGGCAEADTTDTTASDGCDSSSSSSASSGSSDGCGGSDAEGSSASDGCDSSASSGATSDGSSSCEGDSSSSASDGCDSSSSASSSSSCEGEAYAGTLAPPTKVTRHGAGPTRSRAATGMFRLAWPIALAGWWNRRLRRATATRKAFDAHGGVLSPSR